MKWLNGVFFLHFQIVCYQKLSISGFPQIFFLLQVEHSAIQERSYRNWIGRVRATDNQDLFL